MSAEELGGLMQDFYRMVASFIPEFAAFRGAPPEPLPEPLPHAPGDSDLPKTERD